MTLSVRLLRLLAPALLTAVSVAACSSVTAVTDKVLIDNVPATVGGLPPGAPARPAEAPQFLPVNATPPPRDTAPLSAAEQKRLEDELIAIRDRQAASATVAAPANAQPPPATDKKAAKPAQNTRPVQESAN